MGNESLINRVILGTASIGMPNYGFSSMNKHELSHELFSNALRFGIQDIDTSPRYGKAEKLIGSFHECSNQTFQVSTKVDNLLPGDDTSESKIFRSVENSIRQTQTSQIDTLYLHQNDLAIISDKGICEALVKLKNSGYVRKLGVSVYSYTECEFALNSDIYDVIQLPVSIMDSYIYSELIEKNKNNKEILARSVFLQGIVLNRKDIECKIKHSAAVLEYLKGIDGLAHEFSVDMVSLACSFVMSLPNINGMIVGTKSVNNLLKLIRSSKVVLQDELFFEVKAMSDEYKEWSNPRDW